MIKLGQDQRVTINTPSYPLPYRNAAHCNWLVHLPKRESPLSIVAMDFDVGGSAVNQSSCASETVKLYKNPHAFSKYLIGSYCSNSKNVMPREIQYIYKCFAGYLSLVEITTFQATEDFLSCCGRRPKKVNGNFYKVKNRFLSGLRTISCRECV